MKILNFGSCNIDYVYSLNHIVAPGETETSEKLELFPGGKGLNQSIAAAKAGAKIYHAGCIGPDGDILTAVLKQSGVDLTYLAQTESQSGHAIIQVTPQGENSIFIFPGANEKISKSYIDTVLENFQSGDILLLQNEISNVPYIIEKAAKKQMCIILNPSPFHEKLLELDYGKISYLILNEIEAAAISGTNQVEKILQVLQSRYKNLKTVLTLGSKGSVYAGNGVEFHQPAFQVRAVDTTAAGDTFTGYFIAGLALGEEPQKIMKTAAAAAALAVSKKGAAPSIPTKQEVLAALPTLQEHLQNKKSKTLLAKIDTYLTENLKTATLNGLATVLGYSASYTGTLVKVHTGHSFSKALQLKRCWAAAKMLLETDFSVAEIANLTGYENESFFRKIFKEQYGQNPLTFRKNSK